MYTTEELRDKKIIEQHLRKDASLYLYLIGDLDDFFFRYTKWFALKSGEEIRQIVLLYSGTELPVLIALCGDNAAEFNEMKTLLEKIKTQLPSKFHSHLSCGFEKVFSGTHKTESNGKHYRMTIERKSFNIDSADENIRRIIPDDYEKLYRLYEKSYPDNWLDKRMLETGKYFGYFLDGEITGVAGIHVYSPEYRVAALGNITTDPAHRGKSICRKLTSVLCRELFETVDLIGLNVHTENAAAIKSYKNCGFEITGLFEEFMIGKNSN